MTYPDGSSDEVEVDVTVTDNRSDADKYEPTVEGEKVEVGGTVDLTDNVTNLPTLPEGTTVTDVTLVVRLIPTHQVITKGYRSNVSRWYERYSESSSRSDRQSFRCR